MKNLGKIIAFFTLAAICGAFNIATWKVRGFADLYTDNVFLPLTQPYGRLTSLAGFSVGEIMLVVLCVIVALILLCLVASLVCVLGKREAPKGLQFLQIFLGKTIPVLFLVVAIIMSLNCFALYHCTPIKTGEVTKDSYSTAELGALRDFVVTRCNELALLAERDADGNVIYDGDMADEAKTAVRGLSGEYKRMEGFFVTPKVLTFSGFMSQQYMQGYYFPFSMEANINGEMYIMNKPFTMCHELAHTRGYIYEDEANFLGYLACIRSEDTVFEYSGYLGILPYVNNDFYRSVSEDEYRDHVGISDRVRYDSQFLTKEAWEEVEKRSVLDTEMVKKAADTFIDTNLKVNGISSGKASYSHVVGLLLDYYNNNPYN